MSGSNGLARLRQELSDPRVARGEDGWQYAANVRVRALAYARQRRAEGGGIKRIAAELGVPWQTLAYWLKAPGSASTGAALVPVALRGDMAESPGARWPSTLVVHGPLGLRIEGLDIEGLAELLRRLS